MCTFSREQFKPTHLSPLISHKIENLPSQLHAWITSISAWMYNICVSKDSLHAQKILKLITVDFMHFHSYTDLVTNVCIQGACIFVAVMLQYFFTSAFCWMLCEGVILYLMLVVVFSNRFNNRLFFFALGWGMNTTIPLSCVMVRFYRSCNTDSCYFCWNSTQSVWY